VRGHGERVPPRASGPLPRRSARTKSQIAVPVPSSPRADSAVEGSRGSECVPSARRKKTVCTR
jgi:hypothetical protein